MKYIYISLLFASSLFAWDSPRSTRTETPEQTMLKAHLNEIIKDLTKVQTIRKLIPTALAIALSSSSREEQEDQIRLLLCSSLTSKSRTKILHARTVTEYFARPNRTSDFAPVEGVACEIAFYKPETVASYEDRYTIFHERPLETALKQFDACLAKHIALQEKDKQIVEQALAAVK